MGQGVEEDQEEVKDDLVVDHQEKESALVNVWITVQMQTKKFAILACRNNVSQRKEGQTARKTNAETNAAASCNVVKRRENVNGGIPIVKTCFKHLLKVLLFRFE